MKRAAIYAGTFDPMTLGHLDLVERASVIFDRVVVAVVRNASKDTLFDADQRLDMVREVLTPFDNVEAVAFDGLLVDFAHARGIHVLIRGIRAYSDFEYEFQMALTNRKLAPDVETLFMMPKETHSYISSHIVREAAELGGDIGDFVPPHVKACMETCFQSKAAANGR